MGNEFVKEIKRQKFLFEELVKRDFKKKYKRTVLGFLWSMLSPLFMLGVMSFIFSNFFGRDIEYYVLYLLAGQIVFAYFSEATNSGMVALLNNASIFAKINVPKYLFVLSRSVSALINFLATLVIFFCFVFAYGIEFNLKMLLIFYPVICLIIFNYGVGLFLSALYMFFRDMQYLYSLITQVIMYGSAIFYTIDMFAFNNQMVFYLNPLYIYISYIRDVVIYNRVPSATISFLCIFYAIIALSIGGYVYKKYNYKFIYYI